MRYLITSNCQNLSMNWEKWNFEPITNSEHTTEFLTFGNALNILYRLFEVLPKQRTCEMKTLQVQVCIPQ